MKMNIVLSVSVLVFVIAQVAAYDYNGLETKIW